MGKILALDQASHISGWAIYDLETGQIEHGKFNATSEIPGERLFFIHDQVRNLIENNQIEYLIFEDIQLQQTVNGQAMYNNVQTFKVLAEVYGVVDELATELNIPHSSVLASSWKSKLGITGAKRDEQKRNAQNYILTNYKVKATQDECDAICILLYYLASKNYITLPPKVMEKKVKDFDWS